MSGLLWPQARFPTIARLWKVQIRPDPTAGNAVYRWASVLPYSPTEATARWLFPFGKRGDFSMCERLATADALNPSELHDLRELMSDYADRVSDNWFEEHSTSSRRWVISRRRRGRPWDLRCTLSCQRTVGPSSAGKTRRTRQEATPRSTALAVLPDFLEHSLLFGLRKIAVASCKKPKWSASSGVAGPDGSCALGGRAEVSPRGEG